MLRFQKLIDVGIYTFVLGQEVGIAADFMPDGYDAVYVILACEFAGESIGTGRVRTLGREITHDECDAVARDATSVGKVEGQRERCDVR